MLKGDLVTTPLPAVLRQLADGVVSGCLHVDDGVGGTAKVFLRGGQVYSVQVPGRRPQLGARLVSSGALGPEALAEALEAQRTELQGWRLGELLVHLGYVDQPIVESFVHEQLREQTSDLMRWPTGSWKFRVNERTREDVAPPTSVEELLESVEQRRAQWDVITEVLHGPDAVPMLSAAGQTDAEMSIDPESWSLLCKVDGVRSVSELARECGFTLFEAGQVVYSLVRSGLLEVEEVLVGAETAAPPAPSVDSVTSRLAMAFAPASESEIVIPAQAEEMSPADVANLVAKALREDRTLDNRTAASDEIDASVGRVSQALSALLGDDSSASDDLFAAPKRGRSKIPKPMTLAEEAREKRQEARAKAHAKRRAADADELAQAQAELEAARAAEAEAEAEALAADHQAEIVNLAAARQAAEERAAAEAATAEAEETARLAAEEEARVAAEQAAAEEAQAAAEEAEAARIAAEEDAARLFAEEEARVAAEQAAAEEAERARVEAELREAAEAEAAAAEAARVFAEEEARLAAAQAAAEEAERARVEAELREAAEKQAAEAEAARIAAEQEAARLFAEEEARLAAEAEEQARSSQQRLHTADAFAELSAAAATAGDTMVAPIETVVQIEEHVEDEIEEAPLRTYPPADTDMASLFRELSSLGHEDEPPAPTGPSRPPSKAAHPAASKPKKKGLFGR
ncbi:MAG: hypothetical protein QOG99_3773 [Frankiales bacterium]|nr:hypothetical protein [Frankiales bacterium]